MAVEKRFNSKESSSSDNNIKNNSSSRSNRSCNCNNTNCRVHSIEATTAVSVRKSSISRHSY